MSPLPLQEISLCFSVVSMVLLTGLREHVFFSLSGIQTLRNLRCRCPVILITRWPEPRRPPEATGIFCFFVVVKKYPGYFEPVCEASRLNLMSASEAFRLSRSLNHHKQCCASIATLLELLPIPRHYLLRGYPVAFGRRYVLVEVIH